MSARLIESSNNQLYPRQFYAREGQMPVGLVPDDVLLVPRHAPKQGEVENYADTYDYVWPDEAFTQPGFYDRDLSSRLKPDTSVYLDKGKTIRASIGIVAAPMLDVVNEELAIALGKAGGVPIVHRVQTRDEQANMIENIKGAFGYVYERPPTLPRTATVFNARENMQRGIVVVTDDQNHILGIVTRRDVKKGQAPQDKILDEVMTPYDELVTVRSDVDTKDPQNIMVVDKETGQIVRAVDLLWAHRIEKLIVEGEDRQLQGVITDYDLRMMKEFPHATVDSKGNLIVGAAIGITNNYMRRVEKLVEAGVNFICIDVANAYIDSAILVVKKLKKKYPNLVIMAGSVATRAGVRKLAEAGCDIIRFGIGGGSICITRGISGFGYPGLTAVMKGADEADKFGVPLVADGGVRNSADFAKYIAAGATVIMLGKKLAAAEESPAEVERDEVTGRKWKIYRGMASDQIKMLLLRAEGRRGKDVVVPRNRKPEGVPIKIQIEGTVFDIVNDLIMGTRSGMTYGGVSTMEQLRNEVDFVRITPAGQRESGVQD